MCVSDALHLFDGAELGLDLLLPIVPRTTAAGERRDLGGAVLFGLKFGLVEGGRIVIGAHAAQQVGEPFRHPLRWRRTLLDKATQGALVRSKRAGEGFDR